MMNFPCSSADLQRAVLLRQQLEARLADFPGEIRPQFEELVGILVNLEQSHLALEWSGQLPSPVIGLTRLPERLAPRPALLCACEDGRLSVFLRQESGEWLPGEPPLMPEPGIFLGTDVPFTYRGSLPAAAIVLKAPQHGAPDPHYQVSFSPAGKLELRPYLEEEQPTGELIVPRRYGKPSEGGLSSMSVRRAAEHSQFILAGQSLLGDTCPLGLSFQPLAVAFTSRLVFAALRGERIYAWQWQEKTLQPLPGWPSAGLNLEGEVRSLAIWTNPQEDKPYLLAATDERKLFLIDAGGVILRTRYLEQGLTAIETSREGLWLADETGWLGLVRPVYAPLAEMPLPSLSSLLRQVKPASQPELYQSWLTQGSAGLAAAAVLGLAGALDEGEEWPASTLMEFGRQALLDASPDMLKAVAASLSRLALASDNAGDPRVAACLEFMVLLTGEIDLERQRFLDRLTGRLAARFDHMIHNQSWQALDDIRSLDDFELAQTLGAEPALSAYAEMMIHRRAAIWTFASDSPIRFLSPLPGSTGMLIVSKEGLYIVDYRTHAINRDLEQVYGTSLSYAPIHMDDSGQAGLDLLLVTLNERSFLFNAPAGDQLNSPLAMLQVGPETRSFVAIPAQPGLARQLVVGCSEGCLHVFQPDLTGGAWQQVRRKPIEEGWLQAFDYFLPQDDPAGSIQVLAGGGRANGTGGLYLVDIDKMETSLFIQLKTPVMDARVIRASAGWPACIALVCSDGFVYLLDLNGQMQWCYQVGRAARNLEIFDLMGDGQPEIIVGGETGDSHVVVLGLDGSVHWIIPTQAPVTHVKAVRPPGRAAHLLIADQENIVQVVEVIPPGSETEKALVQRAERRLEEFTGAQRWQSSVSFDDLMTHPNSPALQGYGYFHLAQLARRGENRYAWLLREYNQPLRNELEQQAYTRALVRAGLMASPPTTKEGGHTGPPLPVGADLCVRPLPDLPVRSDRGDSQPHLGSLQTTPTPETASARQFVERLVSLLNDGLKWNSAALAALQELTQPGCFSQTEFPLWQPLLLAAARNGKPEHRHAVLCLLHRLCSPDDPHVSPGLWNILAVIANAPDRPEWIIKNLACLLRDYSSSPLDLWRRAHRALAELHSPAVVLALARRDPPLLASEPFGRALGALGRLAQAGSPADASRGLKELVQALEPDQVPELHAAAEPYVSVYHLMGLGLEHRAPEEWRHFILEMVSTGGMGRLRHAVHALDPDLDASLIQVQEAVREISRKQGRAQLVELRRFHPDLENIIERLFEGAHSPLTIGLVGMLNAWMVKPGGVLARWVAELDRPAEPRLEIASARLEADQLTLSVRLVNPSLGKSVDDLTVYTARAEVNLAGARLKCQLDAQSNLDQIQIEPNTSILIQLRVTLDPEEWKKLEAVPGSQVAGKLDLPVRWYFLPHDIWLNPVLQADFQVEKRPAPAIQLERDLPYTWAKTRPALESLLKKPGGRISLLECVDLGRASLVELLPGLAGGARPPLLDGRDWLGRFTNLRVSSLQVNLATFLGWAAERIWPEATAMSEIIYTSGTPVFHFNQVTDNLPRPSLVLLNHWDALLLGVAQHPEQWSMLDEAVGVLAEWSQTYNIHLVLVGGYLSRRIMRARWPALAKTMPVVSLNRVEIEDPEAAAELEKAVSALVRTGNQNSVLRWVTPPVKPVDLVRLSGGSLACLELLLGALEYAKGLEGARSLSLEELALEYARQKGFFARWWMWQDFYTRLALALVPQGEIAVERKNHVEAGFVLAKEYYTRSPDGRPSPAPALPAGAVLREADINKINSNQYYQYGDITIRGFVPRQPAPSEAGPAGEMWLRVFRSTDVNAVLDELVEDGILRTTHTHQVKQIYQFALPVYERWIIESGIWEHLQEAARSPIECWYPPYLAYEEGKFKSALLFPDHRPGAAYVDLPLAQLAAIEAVLDKDSLPLFLTAYGLRVQNRLASARARWEQLVRFSQGLQNWLGQQATPGEAAAGYLDPLFDLLNLVPYQDAMDGKKAILHLKPDQPNQSILFAYTHLGEKEQVLGQQVIFAILRDAHAYEQAAASLQTIFYNFLFKVYQQEIHFKGTLKESELVDRIDRSVVYALAPDFPEDLRKSMKSIPGGPHMVPLTPASLSNIAVSSEPSSSLLQAAYDFIGRHPFSPYQISGTLPAGSRLFVGRNGEVETILKNIDRQDFAILSSRKMGKSSLLQRLAYELRLPQTDQHAAARVQPGIICLYLVMQENSDEKFFYDQLRGALEYQAQRKDLAVRLAQDPNGNFTDLHDVMLKLRHESGHPVVMLIDEVDGLYMNDHRERLFKFLRNNLAQCQPRLCTFILAGYRTIYLKRLSHDSVFFNFTQPQPLSGVDLQATGELVLLLQRLEIKLEKADEFIRKIWEETYGIPTHVQHTCDSLLRHLDAAHRDDPRLTPEDAQLVIEQDIKTLLFAELWSDLEADPHITGLDTTPTGRRRIQLKWKIILLSIIIHLYGHKEDVKTAKLDLVADRRLFDANQAIQYVKNVVGKDLGSAWELLPDEVEKLLSSLTMTLALSIDDTNRKAFYFPNDILPDLLWGRHRQKQMDLSEELIGLVKELKNNP